MGLIHTEAIVLKNKILGESDRLVYLFTLNQGKIKGIAKGARRVKNRFGSALEPFTHTSLFIYERRTGGLFQIQDAEIIQSFQELRESFKLIFYASHFMKWIDAFLPEGEARPSCFRLLRAFLNHLGEAKDVESLARYFEIKVLDLSGYRPRLDVCGKCERMLEKSRVLFSPLEGRGFCDTCHVPKTLFPLPLSPGAMASLHQILTLSPNKVSRLQLSASIRDELQTMTREYAKHLLGKEMGVEPLLCDTR